MNSSLEGDSIRYHANINLGIAVALDWGLIVPVVKNSEEKNFLGLQRAMERNYNDGEPLTKDDMRRIAGPWSPWSTVGTWYMWRSLDPVSF